MKIGKISLLMLSFTIGLSSCKNDDDVNTEVEVVPPRDRDEVQDEDDAEIIEYLTTHYYNAGDFNDNIDAKISDLKISTTSNSDTDRILFTDDNIDNDAVETLVVTFVDVDYKIYILTLNKGGGAAPNFSDAVRVKFEGSLLESGTVFNSAITPTILNLVGNRANIIAEVPGWRKVMPLFNVSESFTDASDGTVNYSNHGSGVMFLPSGLGDFSSPRFTNVPQYASLIFKFELLQTFESDFDNDGVPSHIEDVSSVKDGEFFIEPDNQDNDDDTDNDGIPDYVDSDDDGDGVLTINEDLNNDGDPTNDIGKNGIPNYLDPEETDSK